MSLVARSVEKKNGIVEYIIMAPLDKSLLDCDIFLSLHNVTAQAFLPMEGLCLGRYFFRESLSEEVLKELKAEDYVIYSRI